MAGTHQLPERMKAEGSGLARRWVRKDACWEQARMGRQKNRRQKSQEKSAPHQLGEQKESEAAGSPKESKKPRTKARI